MLLLHQQLADVERRRGGGRAGKRVRGLHRSLVDKIVLAVAVGVGVLRVGVQQGLGDVGNAVAIGVRAGGAGSAGPEHQEEGKSGSRQGPVHVQISLVRRSGCGSSWPQQHQPAQPEDEEQQEQRVAALFRQDRTERLAGVGVLDAQHGEAEALEVLGHRRDLDAVADGLVGGEAGLDPVLLGPGHRKR